MSHTPQSHTLRQTAILALTLLLIEFLDEFVYGASEAAWPLIRADLGLNYVQVGLLLSVPSLVSSLVEPIIGILGDVWRRRLLILGGGALFGLALLLTALSQDFPLLLASFVLFYPASGAFVSLSQATLMDSDPTRHEQNMARWTLAGLVGVVVGPLALGAAAALGLGWRAVFFFFAGLTLVLLAVTYRVRLPSFPHSHAPKGSALKTGLLDSLRALQRGEVLRWLMLLQFSDLMLDVLLSFLALYFVDVVGVNPVLAGAAVAVWTVAGLSGNLLLIPFLERVRGLHYLRLSAAMTLVLFPTLLLTPNVWTKFVLLGLLGFSNAGWYSILKAQLYSAMPGQSGTVMAVDNIFGLASGLIPLGLGLVAERLGLAVAMWSLLAGPVALLVFIPWRAARSC